MKNLLYGTLSAFIVLLGVCAGYLTQRTLSLLDATKAEERLVAESVSGIPQLVNRRLDSLQSEAMKRIDVATTKADKHITAVEKIAGDQLSEANHSIASLSRSASDELYHMNNVISHSAALIASDVHVALEPLPRVETELGRSVSFLTEDLRGTLKPIGSIASQIDSASPLFLDCDHNSSCLFNRWVGTSRAIEGIAIDTRRVADRISKPLGWKGRTWEALRIGAGIGYWFR